MTDQTTEIDTTLPSPADTLFAIDERAVMPSAPWEDCMLGADPLPVVDVISLTPSVSESMGFDGILDPNPLIATWQQYCAGYWTEVEAALGHPLTVADTDAAVPIAVARANDPAYWEALDGLYAAAQNG